MKNSYLWIGAVVIVVLIAGYYLLAQTQRKAAPTTTPSQSVKTKPATESAEQIEKNFVEAEDQPAGTTVVTKTVKSEQPGFIAIHVDVNGQPGKVIGNSSLFPAGLNQNIISKVSPSTKAGDVVYAMYHTDANNNNVYEFPGDDAPIKDSKGNVVMAKITIK
mgnify:FL=1